LQESPRRPEEGASIPSDGTEEKGPPYVNREKKKRNVGKRICSNRRVRRILVVRLRRVTQVDRRGRQEVAASKVNFETNWSAVRREGG